MRIPLLLAMGTLATLPASSEAQVSGTVVIGTGPIGGIIRIGEPAWRRDVVVVERRAPRVIVVERVHRKTHRRHPVWGYRDRGRYDRVIVFYDRRRDRFYDRYRPGLIEIEVIGYRGKYYLLEDDRYHRRDRDRRYDDRWDDDYRGRARPR